MKQRYIGRYLLFFLLSPLLMLLTLFLIFYPSQLVYLLDINYFFLFSVVAVFASKAGLIRLGDAASRMPYPRFIARILLAQLSLTALFLLFMSTCFNYIPVDLTQELNRVHIDATLFAYFYKHWGLYPWSFYILTALILAYFFHTHPHYGSATRSFSTALNPLVNHSVYQHIAPSFDFTVRVANLFSLGIFFAFLILQMEWAVSRLLKLPMISSFTFGAIAIGFIVFGFMSSKRVQKVIDNLIREGFSLAGILLIFMVFVGLLLLILHGSVDKLISSTTGKANIKEQLQYFFHGGLKQSYLLMTWAWLGLTSFFFASFIANQSKGFTMQQVILTNLVYPLSLLMIDVCHSHQLLTLFTQTILILHHPGWNLIASTLSTILILSFFKKQSDFVRLDTGLLNTEQQKPLRRPARTTQQLIHLIAGILGIFWFSWLYILPTVALLIMVNVMVAVAVCWLGFMIAIALKVSSQTKKAFKP